MIETGRQRSTCLQQSTQLGTHTLHTHWKHIDFAQLTSIADS